MPNVEDRLRALEARMAEQDSLLEALRRQKSVLGSADTPIVAIYLKANGQRGVAKLTFDDVATPAVAVEKVR